MLKSKDDKITAKTTPDFSSDSINIQAGSVIIDNKWVSYKGTIIKIRDYISSVVRGSRTRFFKDRGYAVYLMIGLDPEEGIKIAEGRHVKFSTLKAVPLPENFSFLPLIGVVLVQDGSRDLVNGFKPVNQENIFFFSGSGNVLDKNLKGVTGDDSLVYGETGLFGYTGLEGLEGDEGKIGLTGYPGPTEAADRGHTGAHGATGINWNIHIPFQEFF